MRTFTTLQLPRRPLEVSTQEMAHTEFDLREKEITFQRKTVLHCLEFCAKRCSHFDQKRMRLPPDQNAHLGKKCSEY